MMRGHFFLHSACSAVLSSLVLCTYPSYLSRRSWTVGCNFCWQICSPLDRLLGLYWTGLTLLNGFSFLVIFFFFILGCVVD